MPRLAADGAAEGGFARGGRLEDAAFRTRARVVGRGLARRGWGDRAGIPGRAFRRGGVCGLLIQRDSRTPLPDLESELRSPRTPQGGEGTEAVRLWCCPALSMRWDDA